LHYTVDQLERILFIPKKGAQFTLEKRSMHAELKVRCAPDVLYQAVLKI